MGKLRQLWKNHKKTAGLLVAIIGTPLATAIFVVSDHVLTEPVQAVNND